MDDKRFEITKTISNITHNNFDIGDYKMCKQESEIILEALGFYQRCLESADEVMKQLQSEKDLKNEI